MNVACTGCPAKYAIPDEKVRGKKVRITCKHCGTSIVVDGHALSAEPSATASSELETARRTVTSYIVGFPDERQETHTISEIVALYRSAKLDEQTVLWTDGMPDWLPPFEVPEVAEAMHQAGVARRAASSPRPNGEESTRTGSSFFDEPTELSSASRRDLDSGGPYPPRSTAERKPALEPKRTAEEATMQAAPPLASRPSAARRAESRSGGVDLFGGGGPAETETDAALDFGSPEEHEPKLTGARNESSVLFSLDALTKGDPKALTRNKDREREREKEASESLFGDDGPDALLNMGGGDFQALAAPDFTRPVTIAPEPLVRPSEPVEVPNAADRKRGAPLWLVIVLGLAAAAGGVSFVMQRKANVQRAAAPAAPAAPETKAAAPATPSAIPVEAPATSAAPHAARAATAAPATAESVAQATAAAGNKSAPSAPTVNGAQVASLSDAAVATAATPALALDHSASPKKPDEAVATPPPAADSAAFDKSAAVSALVAAAASASSCKQPNGPTGSGKVSVTFAPSGRATMTNVGGDFAGTDVGGCVARLFRAAKVPAFSGEPVTVSKSFTIE